MKIKFKLYKNDYLHYILAVINRSVDITKIISKNAKLFFRYDTTTKNSN